MTRKLGLRVNPDGTTTILNLPASRTRWTAYLESEVGGSVEYVNHRLCGRRTLSLAMRSDGSDGLEINDVAALLLLVMLHEAIPYDLHGPVAFLGPSDLDGLPTGLPEDLAAAMYTAAPGLCASLGLNPADRST
ncbi:hypothetical protein [Kitasatospora sp. MBT63]|uniref:hypothetical protein n=1 Tax=Kitasatospora sp. MBT63 TaxID=1444768 RepID=UPI00053A6C00|nr:hypothetical protein [Kitasatospora sp. MBT63]